jgi:hypothetical protein
MSDKIPPRIILRIYALASARDNVVLVALRPYRKGEIQTLRDLLRSRANRVLASVPKNWR